MLVSQCELGKDIYDVAHQALRRLKGGLGVATVAANAAFAAITGVSIASAAVFTRVSVPEMLRFGYRSRFAVGVVAGGSVLGMPIPPSVMLIVYALITEQSAAQMAESFRRMSLESRATSSRQRLQTGRSRCTTFSPAPSPLR
jgi:TRAP-type C4-dicarboxylate transport system permease large subunit